MQAHQLANVAMRSGPYPVHHDIRLQQTWFYGKCRSYGRGKSKLRV